MDGTEDTDELEQGVALPAPTNLVVTVTSTTGMQLTWNASPGAAKYIIMRGTTAGNVATFTSWPANQTTFLYNHLDLNTQYCWAVRNVNATQEPSAPSNVVCASTGNAPLPPPPQNVVATATSSSRITVGWSAVAGATSYQIFGAAAPGTPVLVGSVNGSTLTFSDTGLTPSTTYNYVVRAITSAGTTADSSPPATATTFALGVELYWKFEARNAQNQFVTSLADVSGFGRNATLSGGAAFVTDRPNVLDDAYTVRLPAGSTSVITRANTSAFNLGSPFTVALWVKPVAAGDFHVIGMRNASCGSLGWEISQNAANGLNFAGETGGVRSFGSSLAVGQWTHIAAASDGATLRLYVNGVQTFSGAYGVGNHLALPLQVGHVGGCAGGEIIVDEVEVLSRALSGAEVAAIGQLPPAPTGLQITANTSTRQDLAWTGVPNTAKHIVYRGTAAGNETFFTSSPATPTTFSYGHLTPGTQYSWQVSAVVGTLISNRSTEVIGTTPAALPAPTGVTATPTTVGRVRVDWTAVPGAVRYYVEKSTNGTTFTNAGSPTTNTFVAAGLTSGTLYTFRVRAQDSGSTYSPYSANVTATAP